MKTVEIAGIRLAAFEAGSFRGPEVNLELTRGALSNLRKILRVLQRGHPVLLVGDAGVGKNALLYYICSRRGQPLLRFSFNEDTRPEDLLGSYRLAADSGRFLWADGVLTRALKTGSLFVADEMNLASREMLKRFLSVFEEGDLRLSEGDGERIQAGDGFIFAATQNPSEGFEGRGDLPRDIQKNFVVIRVDPYPPEELAAILRGLYPSLSGELIGLISAVNERVEDLLRRGRLGAGDLEDRHFNLRNMKRLAARLAAPGANVFAEFSDVYVQSFQEREDRRVVARIVREESRGLVLQRPSRRPFLSLETSSGTLRLGRAILARLQDGGKLAENDIASLLRERLGERAPRVLPYVLLPSRRALLEGLARSAELGENMLLESEPDVETGEIAEFIAALMGKRLRKIPLARGMRTEDILGAYKPASDGSLVWRDGPLTEAIENGDCILLSNPDAPGPELTEKLNMLTDDARAIVLDPRSGREEPLALAEDALVFAVRNFRERKRAPAISRAFRNRFTCFTVPPVTDRGSLALFASLILAIEPKRPLVDLVAGYHLYMRRAAQTRTYGAENIKPYEFGLSNLRRFCEYLRTPPEDDAENAAGAPGGKLLAGARFAYTNEIADPEERLLAENALLDMLAGRAPEALLAGTGGALAGRGENEYYGEILANFVRLEEAGDFAARSDARKEDVEAQERSGKEGRGGSGEAAGDADGSGKGRGRGIPGEGGGAWGVRTEELYREFLKKRKPLWPYSLGLDPDDFDATLGPQIERVRLDMERLLEPRDDEHVFPSSSGNRPDPGRYMRFRGGRGDARVFDERTRGGTEKIPHGAEIVFAVNKGRRIFNFEYALASLAAVMCALDVLENHGIEFSVLGYSDKTNQKRNIDLERYKKIDEPYDARTRRKIFQGLSDGWGGDTVVEHRLLESVLESFSSEARTKIVVFFSDFRGARARHTREKDLLHADAKKFKELIQKRALSGFVFLGAGLGPRNLAADLLPHSVQVSDENFASLPRLTAAKIIELLHRHHD